MKVVYNKLVLYLIIIFYNTFKLIEMSSSFIVYAGSFLLDINSRLEKYVNQIFFISFEMLSKSRPKVISAFFVCKPVLFISKNSKQSFRLSNVDRYITIIIKYMSAYLLR
jgi:hypothetical protein